MSLLAFPWPEGKAKVFSPYVSSILTRIFILVPSPDCLCFSLGMYFPRSKLRVGYRVFSYKILKAFSFSNYSHLTRLLPGTIAASIAEADAIFDHWEASDPSDLSPIHPYASPILINIAKIGIYWVFKHDGGLGGLSFKIRA